MDWFLYDRDLCHERVKPTLIREKEDNHKFLKSTLTISEKY